MKDSLVIDRGHSKDAVCTWVLLLLLAVFGWTSAAAMEQVTLVLPEKETSLLANVGVSKVTFNPAAGDEVSVYFELKRDAAVSASVYDADWNEVAILADDTPFKAGKNGLLWSGSDRDGEVVPDEAYFFVVRASDPDGYTEVYDPTAFSGGLEYDITQAKVDAMGGNVRYRLPELGRVSIRIGLQNGPLMKTLVDWKPRLAGEVTEYWQGKDEDGLIDLVDHPRRKMIITYFSLPENTVITFGNDKQGSMVAGEGRGWPVKPHRETDWAKDRKVSPHYRIPRSDDVSPDVVMDFPKPAGSEGNVIVLKGRTLVRVRLDEKHRRRFENSRYEISFFLDGDFLAEEETGYTPYNWVWDTGQVEAGEYLLTVNLSGFKDQIGVKSARIKIVR